jgi:hypothetical protein
VGVAVIEYKEMIDLNTIKERINKQANGLRLTRENYAEITDLVVGAIFPEEIEALSTADVHRLYTEASRMNTDDWLDLACFRAACKIRRAKAALNGDGR